MTLRKTTGAREIPQSSETRSSFQTTRSASRTPISPRERPRMIVTDACPPAFPPVSMIIGMNAVSTTQAASALSYADRIFEVNVADTINSSSHGIRDAHDRKMPVFRYGFSDGRIAAICSMSSVASDSMTSIASSTVTIPTRRSSPSITGMARNPYFLI